MTDAPLMTLTFALPFPPSVNTMWRHVVLGKRSATLLSKKGRDYRVAVQELVLVQRVPRHALKGRLSVQAIAYPPDRRARDLDNLWKGCLDALTHAGVIGDDADIDELSIRRGPVRPGGELEIRVSEIAHEPAPLELALRELEAAGEKLLGSKGHWVDEPSIVLDKPPF